MSKKKSFTTEALSTITGGDAPTPTPTTRKKRAATPKKAPAKPTSLSSVQPIVSRNTSRTGKPVTLYLNTVNYQLFKQKAKEEGKAASAVLNEMIVEYLS